MFKTDKFRISKPMYAVDLEAFARGESGDNGAWEWHQFSVPAVWFRRKRAQYNGPIRTAACAGNLRSSVTGARPVDALDFLARFTDGRYGGDCIARWDGDTLWSLEPEDSRARYKNILVPMLAAYPAIPEGFDGWWWFG
jgi:hypothetical protein